MLRWMLLLALALAVTTEAATPGYSKVISPSVDCVQRHQPSPPLYFVIDLMTGGEGVPSVAKEGKWTGRGKASRN